MRVHLVDDLTKEQIDEAVQVIVTTFCNDDGEIEELVMKCFTGNDPENLKLYARAMVQDANLMGHVFIATEGELWPAPIISIGLCWEPGKFLWATKEQRELGFDELFAAISPDTRKFWAEVKNVGDQLKAEHGLSSMPLDTFYVNMMLTARISQKRGYGKAVMMAIIAYAAEDGRKWDVGLITQSAENRDWYVSLGFEEAGSMEVAAAPYGDFIPMYAFKPYKTAAQGSHIELLPIS
ncbi:hypothetical protein C8R42DRAFT_91995 [Lentinula raphanica]|nr:hypothetical protein C8R42DRAFT_91995 [Lentinula raphanica]